MLVLLDQVPERRERGREVRIAEDFADAILEPGQSLFVDRSGARQFHGRDALARGALDDAQHVSLARRHEQDRFAAAPGAAGAADAVHVGFGVVRNVVVDHVADAIDVEAARGDVGGDEDVEVAAS